MKFVTETFAGLAIEIHIDPSGLFSADVPEYEGNPIRGASIEQLRERIRKAIQKLKARTALPITVFDVTRRNESHLHNWMPGHLHNWMPGRGLLHCTLRGVHERSGALLLQGAKGQNFQIDEYSLRRNTARRFTDEEIALYAQLTRAVDEAEALLLAFLDTVRIDPVAATTIGPVAEEDH